MAHIENILRDKLFVFSGSTKTTETESEILSLIAEKANLGDTLRTSLIDNEENHDSYKLETSKGKYLIKISLDESYSGFQKEFEILNILWELNLAPQAICHGEITYGSKIVYLVTSYENAQSATELGKSILSSNYEGCLRFINQFHKINADTPSLKERIKKIFAATNFENQPEFLELIKAASINYNLLAEEILEIKQYIQDSYKDQFGGKSLCHSNLNPSTILFGRTKISFINWQDSFVANPMIDLSNIRMEFDFDENFEYKIFQYYNSLGAIYLWEDYLAARNFWASIKLLEYVYSYIKEIYLFKSMRQDKILKIFSSFCRNMKFFEHIPSFRKNKDKLLKLFSLPMI